MGTGASPWACTARAFAVVIVVLSLGLDAVQGAGIPAGLGPFRIEFRGVTQCPGAEKCLVPDKMSVSNIKVTKDPKEDYRYSYNMDVNSTVTVDDNYKSEIAVSRWSAITSGWTNNVFRMTVPNPCSAFKTHRPDLFKQVSDLYYGGNMADCPFQPVAAKVRDFSVEGKPPSNIKSLPYGRFRARNKLIDPNQECLSCFDIVVDVLPKRRG